jgi:hypothetical protein
MSKFISGLLNQNVSAYSLNGDLLNYSLITHSNPSSADDAFLCVQQNIADRSNPAYVFGAVLRYIWDNLPIFSLPNVAAVELDEDLIQELNRDEELENALLSARIEVYQEEIPDLERDRELIRNLASEIRLAAAQGDRSRSLILGALNDLDLKILVFDTSRSKEAIDEYMKDKGAHAPLATYDTDDRTMRVFAFWDGKFSSGILIHEMGHADEFQRGIEYDKDQIDQCFGSLKDWENQLFSYLSKYSRGKESQVDHLAKNYRGIFFQDPSVNFLGMFGNYYDKESKVLTLNFGGNKGVNILSKVLMEEDRVIHEPFAVINARNGKRREITETEKEAYHAYFSSYQLAFANRVLNERYSSSVDEEREINLKEMHAYLRTLVPEGVLNVFCPQGFVKKPEPESEMKPKETKGLVAKNDKTRSDL